MKLKNTPVFYILLVVLAMMLCMTGCDLYDASTDESLYSADPTPPPTPVVIEELSIVVTAEDINRLDDYPDLKKLDLSGSTCYPEIKAYIAAHPEVEVTYTVDILDKSYPGTAAELDLSALTPDQVQSAASALEGFSALSKVNLMAADGTSALTKADVKALMAAAPGVPFYYSFDFYGKQLTTADTYVEYVDVMMGDEAEAELRATLDILPDCYSFILDNCGFTSEVLDKVNKDYPDTKIVWRVFFGTKLNASAKGFTCRTDEEVLRVTGSYTNELRDDSCAEMKYLTEAKYVDIGHNDTLSDISFLQYMPNLEILIVSGSHVQDLTPLSNLKNLEYVELVYCTRLTDLTPLQGCTGLKYLNISYTKVSDLDCLKDLPIERFNCLGTTNMQWAEKEAFAADHPNCLSVFTGSQPYGYGWRYTDYGYTFWDYYTHMRVIFNYDNVNDHTGYGYKGNKL